MKFLVKKIIEPDYGCEERAADYVAMDTVVLTDENSDEFTVQVPDKELYDKDINVGDWVCFDKDEKISKDV